MTATCTNKELGQLLAAYELGLLPQDVAVVFEQHLEDCSDCLIELYEHSSYTTAIHEETGRIIAGQNPDTASTENDGYRPHLADVSTPSVIDRVRRGFSRLRPRPRVFPLGFAALAVILGLLFQLNRSGENFGDLAHIVPLEYVQLETRGSSQEDLDLGFSFYADHRYEQAIVHLERALEANQNWGGHKREQIHLYIGVASILSKRREAAYPHLSTAATSSLLVIADRARWYLAQASLLDENPETAVVYLKDLAGSPVYGERARTLLQKIEQITESETR